jgi:hypothetical protein
MTTPIDLVERLLRLAIAGEGDQALALLDEHVDIRRSDGSFHRGRDAARRLQELDAVLAARVADARLTMLIARADHVVAQAVVTLHPEAPGGPAERIEPAWDFTVAADRITAVRVHSSLTAALAAAGIRSVRDPGVERRLFGWGVLMRAAHWRDARIGRGPWLRLRRSTPRCATETRRRRSTSWSARSASSGWSSIPTRTGRSLTPS